jgi:hypothetical protein
MKQTIIQNWRKEKEIGCKFYVMETVVNSDWTNSNCRDASCCAWLPPQDVPEDCHPK